jgi:hypothetical protein
VIEQGKKEALWELDILEEDSSFICKHSSTWNFMSLSCIASAFAPVKGSETHVSKFSTSYKRI